MRHAMQDSTPFPGRWLSRLKARLQAGDRPAERLYHLAVARARDPVFYSSVGVSDVGISGVGVSGMGVADSARGRFEMICLHVFLLLRRLAGCGPAGKAMARSLYDRMFADMDRSLREMGIGDMSVGKRVKTMASHFHGRIAACDPALAAGPVALATALARNLEGAGTVDHDRLATYLVRMAARLDARPCADLMQATPDLFGPPGQGAEINTGQGTGPGTGPGESAPPA